MASGGHPPPSAIGGGVGRMTGEAFRMSLSPVQEGVEDSSVNTSIARRAVESKLTQRPTVRELMDRNILRSTNPALSPAIQSQAVKLQWEKQSDKLEKWIRRRPEMQEVIQLNILKDPKVHPNIQATKNQLMKKNIAESLNQKLAERPGPLDLIRRDILNPGGPLADMVKRVPGLDAALDQGPVVQSDSTKDGTRRQSYHESQGAPSTLAQSGQRQAKRHSISGTVGMSLSMDDASNMDWEGGQEPTQKSEGHSRKLSESSFSSLPSPIDFSSLQADITSPKQSSEGPRVPSPSANPTTRFQHSCSTSALSAATHSVGVRGGGVAASPRHPRKKPNSKSKMKKYNFHEYKPPTHHGKIEKKPSTTTKLTGPYSLILQQQQILLQIQLLQQQYPDQLNFTLPQIPQGTSPQQQMNILLKALAELTQQAQQHNAKKGAAAGTTPDSSKAPPAPSSSPTSTTTTSSLATPTLDATASAAHTNGTITASSLMLSSESHPSPDTMIPSEDGRSLRLEDIKVNHLRTTLKERGLGVTGKKMELLERLLEHNNRALPASLASEVLSELNARRPSLPTTFLAGRGSGTASNNNTSSSFHLSSAQISRSHRSESLSGPAPQMLKAEQLQEKIKEMCEQKKRDHFSGKPGTLYPAPVVEAMYNFDITASMPPSNLPTGRAAVSTANGQVAVGRSTSSATADVRVSALQQQQQQHRSTFSPPLTFPRSMSLPTSPGSQRKSQEDLLSGFTNGPPLLPLQAELGKGDGGEQSAVSPTQDLLAQLQSDSVAWPPISSTELLLESTSTASLPHPSVGGDPLSSLLGDTPLLTTTASQSHTKSEYYLGCGSKPTAQDSMDTSSLSVSLGSEGQYMGVYDLDNPGPSWFGSDAVNPANGRGTVCTQYVHTHVPNPSPMLSHHANPTKSGSDLYLSGHDQFHSHPHFPQTFSAFGRSPGSDQLEWLDLNTNFGEAMAPPAAHSGLGDFGDVGALLDGPMPGGVAGSGAQLHGSDIQNDFGFAQFSENSDIFPPTSSEAAIIELGMSH